MSRHIVFDIGGTMIKYGVIREGVVLSSEEMPTNAWEGGSRILERVCRKIKELQREGTADLAGIGISTAGMVDPKQGSILYANENIPGYTGMEVQKIIEKSCKLPCRVENDVACAGLSEQRCGAAAGYEQVFCLTIGTGIGGCIIQNGRIFHGSSNSAGEIGYMRIEGEEFQQIASAGSLIRKVCRKKGLPQNELDGREVFRMAKAGDDICVREIEAFCERLCIGIANVCYVLNPEIVVLGGGIMSQKEYLQDLICRKMQKHLLPSVMEKTVTAFAQNGNQAGMLGAYYNFLEAIHE